MQVHRLDRAPRLRLGRSERAPQRRLRPRGGLRLRLRDRPRADCDAPPRRPGHPHVLGERPPLPQAILMRVPLNWLRDYVAVDAPVEELAEKLGTATCEVERIIRRGVPAEDGNLGLYRVGLVLEAGKHPNADRLQLCRVDIGEGEPRQIVCGAWNFGAGATVAIALPGAVLPNGLELERREVRGELSDGMILAEDEVELGTDHSGIMVLPDAEPGTPLADVLPLVDDV